MNFLETLQALRRVAADFGRDLQIGARDLRVGAAIVARDLIERFNLRANAAADLQQIASGVRTRRKREQDFETDLLIINNLIEAAGKGRHDIINNFIKSKRISIHLIAEKALIAAAANGHIDTVKYLVAEGAAYGAKEYAAIKAAIRGGHHDVYRFLVDQHIFEHKGIVRVDGVIVETIDVMGEMNDLQLYDELKQWSGYQNLHIPYMQGLARRGCIEDIEDFMKREGIESRYIITGDNNPCPWFFMVDEAAKNNNIVMLRYILSIISNAEIDPELGKHYEKQIETHNRYHPVSKRVKFEEEYQEIKNEAHQRFMSGISSMVLIKDAVKHGYVDQIDLWLELYGSEVIKQQEYFKEAIVQCPHQEVREKYSDVEKPRYHYASEKIKQLFPSDNVDLLALWQEIYQVVNSNEFHGRKDSIYVLAIIYAARYNHEELLERVLADSGISRDAIKNNFMFIRNYGDMPTAQDDDNKYNNDIISALDGLTWQQYDNIERAFGVKYPILPVFIGRLDCSSIDDLREWEKRGVHFGLSYFSSEFMSDVVKLKYLLDVHGPAMELVDDNQRERLRQEYNDNIKQVVNTAYRYLGYDCFGYLYDVFGPGDIFGDLEKILPEVDFRQKIGLLANGPVGTKQFLNELMFSSASSKKGDIFFYAISKGADPNYKDSGAYMLAVNAFYTTSPIRTYLEEEGGYKFSKKINTILTLMIQVCDRDELASVVDLANTLGYKIEEKDYYSDQDRSDLKKLFSEGPEPFTSPIGELTRYNLARANLQGAMRDLPEGSTYAGDNTRVHAARVKIQQSMNNKVLKEEFDKRGTDSIILEIKARILDIVADSPHTDINELKQLIASSKEDILANKNPAAARFRQQVTGHNDITELVAWQALDPEIESYGSFPNLFVPSDNEDGDIYTTTASSDTALTAKAASEQTREMLCYVYLSVRDDDELTRKLFDQMSQTYRAYSDRLDSLPMPSCQPGTISRIGAVLTGAKPDDDVQRNIRETVMGMVVKAFEQRLAKCKTIDEAQFIFDAITGLHTEYNDRTAWRDACERIFANENLNPLEGGPFTQRHLDYRAKFIEEVFGATATEWHQKVLDRMTERQLGVPEIARTLTPYLVTEAILPLSHFGAMQSLMSIYKKMTTDMERDITVTQTVQFKPPVQRWRKERAELIELLTPLVGSEDLAFELSVAYINDIRDRAQPSEYLDKNNLYWFRRCKYNMQNQAGLVLEKEAAEGLEGLDEQQLFEQLSGTSVKRLNRN